MKKALVMEGGAMRGMFTCGIIDVFMENGIDFDAAVGVSAGAAFGCNIKSRQIGRAIRYNKKYANDPQYAGVKTYFKTGDLYNVKFCYDDIPNRLDPWDGKTFTENPMEFYAVATDIEAGKPVYHLCDKGTEDALKWIRASASIPGVSKPVEIDGGKYLDGGMSDPIPYRFFRDKGYDRIVVIETQPKDFVKQKQKMLGFINFKLRKFPAMQKIMRTRHILYNDEKRYIRECENKKECFVIRPREPLNVGGFPKDANELERVYQEGRKEALAILPALISYLGTGSY